MNFKNTGLISYFCLILFAVGLFFLLSSPTFAVAPNFTADTEPLGTADGLSAGAVAWGDVDRDGYAELVAVGEDMAEEERLLFYRNNSGSPGALTAEPTGVFGAKTAALAFGDYDNDGWLDLAMSGSKQFGNYRLQIFPNSGGTIDWNNPVPLMDSEFDGVKSGGLDWGDYDNDGDLDLVVTGEDEDMNDTFVIYGNDGGSLKPAIYPLGEGGFTYSSVKWGDYDGDGDLDLAVLGGSDKLGEPTLAILENKTDTFVMTQDLGVVRLGAMAWGDYDNDGKMDLAVAGQKDLTGQYFKVYSYDGTSMVDAGVSGVTGVERSAISWGDMDNDGLLDLVLAGYNSSTNRHFEVYKNNGDNTFTSVDEPLGATPGLNQAALDLADYDGDGDLDIAVAGRSGTLGDTYRFIIYKNDMADTTVNDQPNAPSLSTADGATFARGETVILEWSGASDGITPAAGLSYNLKVGTSSNGLEIVAAESMGHARGHNLLGNVQYGDSAWLNDSSVLTPGTYYWSVQTVDGGQNRSFWSGERTFEVLNDTPYIEPQLVDITAAEDTAPMTLYLGDSAHDTSNDPLKWMVSGGGTVVTAAVSGSYTTGGVDTLTLTPVADAYGTDTLTLSLGDGWDTVSQQIVITLTAVNDTPVINSTIPDQQDRAETDPWAVSLAGYATDTEGDPLKWTVSGGGNVVNTSLNGGYTAGGIDTLTISPIASMEGIDTLTLSVGDGEDTVSQKVLVTLLPTNFAPVINSPVADQSEIMDTAPWSIPLKNRASDSENDGMQWSVSGGGTVINATVNGGVSADGEDTLTISPIAGQKGTDTLTLTVTDGTLTSEQQVVVELLGPARVVVRDILVTEGGFGGAVIDTPVEASGVGFLDVEVTLENIGGASATAKFYSGDLKILDWSGENVAANLGSLVLAKGDYRDVTFDVSGRLGSIQTVTWRVDIPGESDTEVLGNLWLKLADTITVESSSGGGGLGAAVVNNQNYVENLPDSDPQILSFYAPPTTVASGAAGLDTFTASSQSVDFEATLADGNSFYDVTSPAAPGDGDSVLVMIQRGDVDSLDTPVTNPAYGFSSVADFRNKIRNADGGLESGQRKVTNGLLIISLWKNKIDLSDPNSYLGDSGVLSEDVQITVGSVADTTDNLDNFKIVKLLPGSLQWVEIDTPTVTGSAGNYKLKFTVSGDASKIGAGFSVFRIISGGAIVNTGTASEAIVYPNPFIPNDGNPSTGEYGSTSGQGIYFGAGVDEGFPAGTKLKIYNVLGERIDSVRTSAGGMIQWDARTRNGDKAASGVYIYRIDVAGGGAKTGKFAIIR